MFHAQSMAANRAGSSDEATSGPIAGIARALPLSLALWVMIVGALRLWF